MTMTCVGCDDPIEEDGSGDRGGHLDVDGEDWHEICYESSGGPTYCCGAIYEDGEIVCASCGDPL
ncbi:hypothetical protein BH92_27870 (plasmid) [Rhodococcoides fascians A21d2]|uniref:hypothetical protein n=1 Tax=Rhodococcoides fascians TaxID=1828 RepID=UPI0012D343F5|nr:hypothetical protein [Rhodococcus fascians]QII03873.1 hypothetical protein BH92_27870 [Rhodococcus fascians A21d2]